MLTVPLTVAVHRIKKPFIYAGFDNLNTDEHRWAQIKNRDFDTNFTNFHKSKIRQVIRDA